ESLSDIVKMSLIGDAGECLRALGRLREATQPMETSLNGMVALEQWQHAVSAANALSRLFQVIGDLQKSTRLAEQAMKLAEHSKKQFEIKFARISLARAYHQEGR